MTALITLTLIIVYIGLWQLRWEDAPEKPKVYPLSEDDQALHAHFLKREEDKVEDLRHTREASRRRYEGITWPAILWEHRSRQIMQHVITRRVA